MVVARLVNWHESLEKIGYPVPWCPEHFVSVLDDRMRRREKAFTGAYVTPAGQDFQGSKAEYLAAEVLGPDVARP